MLALQFLRIVPFVINPIAATIVLLEIDYWLSDIQYPMAVFLFIDWVMSVLIMAYAAWKMRPAYRAGYFQIPVSNSDFNVRYGDFANQPKLSTMESIIIALLDVAFSIALTVLSVLIINHGHDTPSTVIGVFGLITT